MKITDNMEVVISGYGRMGHLVEEVLIRKGIAVALATEDICSVDKELAKRCVCIDFTTPEAFRANYRSLASNFKAVVVGTTGWNDIAGSVISCFEECGTPMIYSSNFSIGVNALFAALRKAGEVLSGHGYDVSVTEIHHVHKLDKPSGTAKTIASIIGEVTGSEPLIESQRIGEVPGTHTAVFSSDVDRITFTHEAYSRQGFAEGAVVAAEMTEGLKGVHEFSELILK